MEIIIKYTPAIQTIPLAANTLIDELRIPDPCGQISYTLSPPKAFLSLDDNE